MTEEQIAKGLHDYIEKEVIPNIPDHSLKTVMGALAHGLKYKPDIVHSLMTNPIMAAFVEKTDDGYDMRVIFDSFEEAIDEYGSITVTIPKVPFIMPNEQVMKFSAEDIGNMRRYLERD